MKTILFYLTLLSGLMYTSGISAQNQEADLIRLMRDDSTDINTIALYNSNVRESIFRVSSHPEGVAKLNDIQKKSNESFRNLLALYSKEEQQKIWNLTRYDNLIPELATTNGNKTMAEKVLLKYPADIHQDALYYTENHFQLITAMNESNKNFLSGFQSVVSVYTPDDQLAFHEIMKTPEALSLLNENMRMTVLLGDIYRSNPTLLRQQFDSLNIVVAEQNAREKEDWKKEMAENPEAEKEMKQSADEYALENGYTQSDYNYSNPQIVDHYIYTPYPYWCGYPWWYQPNYWYPYPYWYHYGYYYWHGGMVWMGPPSHYFVSWHFHHHAHFQRYPHLTNVYINHYRSRPRSGVSRSGVEVNNWMRENESSLPRDFVSNQEQRIERIIEFGQSETDREQYNQKNQGNTLTRDNYMKQHTEEYPHLKQPAHDNNDVRPNIYKPEERPGTPNPQPKSNDMPKYTPPNRTDDKPRYTPPPRNNDQPRYTPPPRNDQPKYTPPPRTNDKPKYTPPPKTNDQPRYTPPPKPREQPKTSPLPR